MAFSMASIVLSSYIVQGLFFRTKAGALLRLLHDFYVVLQKLSFPLTTVLIAMKHGIPHTLYK